MAIAQSFLGSSLGSELYFINLDLRMREFSRAGLIKTHIISHFPNMTVEMKFQWNTFGYRRSLRSCIADLIALVSVSVCESVVRQLSPQI